MKVLEYFLAGFSVLLVLSLALCLFVFTMAFPIYIWNTYGIYYGIFTTVFFWSGLIGFLIFLSENT